MRKRMVVMAAVVGTLGGCASVPDIPDEDYVRVADILFTTECELKEAIDTLKSQFVLNEQTIEATYNLEISDTGKGIGSAGVVVPITNGTFSLGVAAGLSQKVTRSTSFTVAYESKDLQCEQRDEPHAPKRLEGNLGLSDWLLKTAVALRRAEESPVTMTYEVGFDVVRNTELKPAIGLAYPSGDKVGADLTIAGTRQSKNSILVAAAKIGPVLDKKGIKKGTKITPAQAKRNLDVAVQQFLLRKSD